eukprot:TRINITY_DN57218_c0_g1_i1.p1 TRINITY_DN57218_c0_g1~~TRINITY_DN57218_c0_g1_i1.p1  ORF type:complete len:341 (+),score=43.59 TRINITY_DN57218_c0_g1_i1:171-1193(+)
MPGVDVGIDCAVIPLSYPDLSLIQTTDFFYPLVDDPFVQGWIGAANVLSDMYACGTPICDNVLMLIASSTEMLPSDRKICTQEIMRGFCEACKKAGVRVTGGQTVLNPWPIIGGVATSVRKKGDFIYPDGAQVGDALILTKPLGTQIAVNVHEWITQQDDPDKGQARKDRIEKMTKMCSVAEGEHAYQMAMNSMSTLNQTGARLMLKHGAHAATDITGFGVVGHAGNLAAEQKAKVQFKITHLPILAKMDLVDQELGCMFKLKDGKSAETSGGLLIAIPKDKVDGFLQDYKEAEEGCAGWVVGEVVERPAEDTRNSAILADPQVISVEQWGKPLVVTGRD